MKKQTSRKAATISLLERALSLLVVFLLLLATAVSAGRLFGRPFAATTAEKAAATAPDTAAIGRLGLADMQFAPVDSVMWRVSSPDGAAIGTLINTTSLAPDVLGFAGPTPVYVFIDSLGTVAGVSALDNSETSHIFRHVVESGFLDRWNGLSVADAAAKDVDAVTGATYSSRALAGNVQAALAVYGARGAGAAGSGGERFTPSRIALAFVVLLGVFGAFFGRRWRGFRVVLLGLNVLVTGFWCGEYLSVALLRNWLVTGPDWAAALPAFVMLALSLLLAFLKKPQHYCNWICPLGSLQELVYMIPGPKLRVAPKTYRVLGRIRLGALMLLLFTLWMGLGEAVLAYEPFSAFQFASASPAVLVLGGVIVVTSVFVPRPWCRTLCPLGELFKLSEDNKTAN